MMQGLKRTADEAGLALPEGVAPPGTSSFEQQFASTMETLESQVNMVIAFVSEHVPEQGHTLVTEDPNSESANIYILDHRTVDQDSLDKSSAVAFEPQVGEDGKLRVGGAVWLLHGKTAEAVSWGSCLGRVRRADSQTGDAFVDCAEVVQQYGREAYCLRKVVSMCRLQEGSEICFNILLNDAAVPQIPAPIWVKYTGPQSALNLFRQPAVSGTSAPAVTDVAPSAMVMEGLAKVQHGMAYESEQEEPLNPDDLNIAVLLRTFPHKGFSLLTFDPTDEENKIYIHGTVATCEDLDKSLAVAFKPHHNAKGEMQAAAPVWLLVGKAEADTAVSWGQYVGTVCNINDMGDGHISCPEVTAVYGRDAYVFRKVMKMCELNDGDQVCFDIHVNDRNMPQVSSPIWKKNQDWKKWQDYYREKRGETVVQGQGQGQLQLADQAVSIGGPGWGKGGGDGGSSGGPSADGGAAGLAAMFAQASTMSAAGKEAMMKGMLKGMLGKARNGDQSLSPGMLKGMMKGMALGKNATGL